jgi:hypothetical protein
VVALSPGENYREIAPGAQLAAVGDRPVLLFAAEDDTRSAAAVRAFQQANAKLTVTVFDRGGHGNHMFGAHPEALAPVADAVAAALRQ